MRSLLLDSRVQPVENLCQNPSFERAVPGTTIVRRNLHMAPHGAMYMAPNGGSSSRSLETVGGPQGRPWVKYVFSQAPSGSPLSISTSAALAHHSLVRPGALITMSADAFSDYMGYSQIRIDGSWLDSAGNTISGFSGTDNIALPTGRWQRVWNTKVVPAGAAYLRMFVAFSGPTQMPLGTVVGLGGLMVEERPIALPFFAGDTLNDRGIAYSFEGTPNASPSVARAAVVEVRRNHAVSPQPPSPNSLYWPLRWYGGGGGAGTTTVEQGGFGGRLFLRKTWTVSPASPEDTGIGIRTSVVPGRTYTALMRIRASKDMAFRGNADSPAGLVIQGSTELNGSYNTIVPASSNPLHRWRSNNNWVWARTTFTVPDGIVGVQAFFYVENAVINGTWNPGDYLDAMDAVFVEGNYTGEFFDGTTTPDADLTPAWTGTENASPSVLYGVAVAETQLATGRLAIQSYLWPDRTSIRIIPSFPTNADSFVSVGGDGGGPPRMGMRPGRRYTLMAKFFLKELFPHSGGARRELQLRGGPSGNGWGSIANARAENKLGEQIVRFSVFIPEDTISVFVRLYNGGLQGEPDCWWDDLMIVEGDYRGGYIDGDIPGCIWRGNPYESRSVGYPPLQAA